MRRKRLVAAVARMEAAAVRLEAAVVHAEESRRLYELVATKRHNDLLADIAGVDKDVRALANRIARDFKPTKKAT